MRQALSMLLLLWAANIFNLLYAQTSIYASGLNLPVGLEFSDDGNLWVTQVGTGTDDGKVSLIAPDGTVTDVITGLPSFADPNSGETVGAWRTVQMPNNRLMVVVGEGNHRFSGSLIVYDFNGFPIGQKTRDVADISIIHYVQDFVFDQGFQQSNIYSFAQNADGEFIVADAAANALLKRDGGSHQWSIFASFPDIPNTAGFGPPMTNSVPTKVLADGSGGFYVGTLTGFPFQSGVAKVHHVTADGVVSDYATGLTTVVDLAIDPTDSALVALQFAEFGMGFTPGSAKAVKINADGSQTVMAEGFGPASAMTFSAAGELFVSSIFTGEVLKISTAPPAPPANDNLCDAMPLTVGDACNGVTNIVLTGGTMETNEPIVSCILNMFSPDSLAMYSVWYSFVAPAGEIFTIATPNDISGNRSYKMDLFTLTGDCSDLSGLESVDCSDGSNNLVDEPVLITTLSEGETYYLRVAGQYDGFTEDFLSPEGCITIFETEKPANDEACDAIELTVNADAQVFNNLGATANPAEFGISPPPSSNAVGFSNDGWALGSNFIDNSVWFKFTSPADGGNVTIDLTGSNGLPGSFNTQVAVYEATDCGNYPDFSFFAAGDNRFDDVNFKADGHSKLDLFCLEGNKTYYVLVDGGSSFFFQPSRSQGYFSIQITAPQTVPLSMNPFAYAPDCPGDSNGSLLIQPEGGAGDYRFLWSNGDTTSNLYRSLETGTYTLTMTDMCGAELIESFDVPESTVPALIVDAGDDLSGREGSDVQLNATVSGGLPLDSRRIFSQSFYGSGQLGLWAASLNQLGEKDTFSLDHMVQLWEMEFVGDDLYGFGSSGNYFSINQSTGEMTKIDSVELMTTTGALFPPSVADFSYVPSSGKAYIITSEGDIYELNPTTGAISNRVATGLENIAAATIDNSGTAYIWSGGMFHSVPVTTGVPTAIGDAPLNSLPFRAMETDPQTDKIYFSVNTSAFLGSPRWSNLREFNKTDGTIQTVANDFSSTSNPGAVAFKKGSSAPYQYSWSPAAGLDDPTIANPTFTVDATTTFTVEVTDGCGTWEDEVTVEMMPSVNSRSNLTGYPPAAEAWAMGAIEIFPNPAADKLNIFMKNVTEEAAEIRIRDLNGRILKIQSVAGEMQRVDISELISGQYLLEIRGKEQVVVKRFLKM